MTYVKSIVAGVIGAAVAATALLLLLYVALQASMVMQFTFTEQDFAGGTIEPILPLLVTVPAAFAAGFARQRRRTQPLH